MSEENKKELDEKKAEVISESTAEAENMEVKSEETSTETETQEANQPEVEASKDEVKAVEVQNKEEAEVSEEAKTDDIPTEAATKKETATAEAEIDLSTLSLDELMEQAKLTIQLSPKKAASRLKQIRPLFFNAFQNEKKTALDAYITEGKEPEAFAFEKEAMADDFGALLTASKEALEEDKKRIEEEKKVNLKRKEALITELEEILQNDETLDTIKRVKEIQSEWKSIKGVDKEKLAKLWDKYNFLMDKFYDNHSINIELKDLDRKKNLSAKIELTKKVEELLNEKSVRKSFIMLNKYHEDFKNLGPIPAESREAIWEAFKKASDSVYESKREELAKLDAVKEENLKLKELLVEKSRVLCEVMPTEAKGFNTTTKKLEEIFEEWKKIGRVPQANNDKVWNDFNEIRNTFYTKRKEYFAEANKHRKANLILKQDLCKRVEALVDDTNWADTTKEIIGIQNEWKKIGPVPDRDNQTIWKRFRKACDAFFNNKTKAFEGQHKLEEENLVKKNEILAKLEALVKAGNEKGFEEMRELTAEWKSIGFVPRKAVKKVNDSYRKLSDELYKKFNKSRESLKANQLEDHYKKLSSAPNAEMMLQKERNGIKRKINFLNDEILSIERNMSFFAKSATAEKMLKDFESKIASHRKNIDKLKKELKVIKKATASPKADAPEEETMDSEESTD